MAAGSAEILQEYLVKLGFVTDKLALKKMDDTLLSVGKKVLGVGAAVGEMVVAAEIAVGLFANQMEKLYYASKLSGSSAANFKALGSAQEAVGLSSGTIERVTKNINLAMNSGNPAMQSYINNVLGVKTAGRDMTAVLLSSAQAIKKISEQQGDIPAKAAAARLGFSDEDYFQLIKTDGALEKLIATDAKRKAALASAGVDYDKATAAGVAYSNMLGELAFKLGVVKDAILVNLLPAFQKMAEDLSLHLSNLAQMISGKSSWFEVFKDIGESPALHPKSYNDAKAASDEHSKALAFSNAHPAKQANALDGLFSKGEGGYNSVNRGAYHGYAAGTENLESMSLNQVRAAQMQHKFNAAGHYQIIGTTLADAMRSMNLNGDEKFDKAMQDKIFKDFLITKKRPAIGAYLNGGGSKNAALADLSKEWASFTDPTTGKSHYAKDGVNKASISLSNAGDALDAIRNTRLASKTTNGSASIVQTNTFNINGTDGHALSKALIVAQARTNADAVRALGSKVS